MYRRPSTIFFKPPSHALRIAATPPEDGFVVASVSASAASVFGVVSALISRGRIVHGTKLNAAAKKARERPLPLSPLVTVAVVLLSPSLKLTPLPAPPPASASSQKRKGASTSPAYWVIWTIVTAFGSASFSTTDAMMEERADDSSREVISSMPTER